MICSECHIGLIGRQYDPTNENKYEKCEFCGYSRLVNKTRENKLRDLQKAKKQYRIQDYD